VTEIFSPGELHIAATCIKAWVTKRNITERKQPFMFSKKRGQICPNRKQEKKDVHRRPIVKHLKGRQSKEYTHSKILYWIFNLRP
jgi:hypothetical protein